MHTRLVELVGIFLLAGVARLWLGGLARLWEMAPRPARLQRHH